MGYGNRPSMPNNGYKKDGFNKNYNKKNNNFKSGHDNGQYNKKNNFNSSINGTNNKFSKDKYAKKTVQNNNFSQKDEEDIYSPKVYAKKPKEKSQFDSIIIPEYEIEKQRMRNKRSNDKKYKNKGRNDY